MSNGVDDSCSDEELDGLNVGIERQDDDEQSLSAIHMSADPVSRMSKKSCDGDLPEHQHCAPLRRLLQGVTHPTETVPA